MAPVRTNWARRSLSVPAVSFGLLILTLGLPAWVLGTVVFDLVRGRPSCPTFRLAGFGYCWCALETAGVMAAGWLWVVGRRGDIAAHYRLQRWWASHLIGSLRRTTGLRVDISGADDLGDGPFVALCRHASLADALVSAWVFGTYAHLRPRYVLKKELKWDPCLDIVGHRLPNYFVDRGSTNVAGELAGIERMATDLGTRDVAVIFPEGTRASGAKRTRELQRLQSKDPGRAARLAVLRRLLPPKHAGASALLRAVPRARVVAMWHVGFDGMDTFSGILRRLRETGARARIHLEVLVRPAAADGPVFISWLDDVWMRMDAAVDAAESTLVADVRERMAVHRG